MRKYVVIPRGTTGPIMMSHVGFSSHKHVLPSAVVALMWRFGIGRMYHVVVLRMYKNIFIDYIHIQIKASDTKRKQENKRKALNYETPNKMDFR